MSEDRDTNHAPHPPGQAPSTTPAGSTPNTSPPHGPPTTDSPPDTPPTDTAAPKTPPPTLLQRLDRTMGEHPWYPRVTPFAVYLILLWLTRLVSGTWPSLYAPLYVLQCGTVVWLLWRYRKLLPEQTLSFHWLAVPVGVGVFVAWVWIGMAIDEFSYVRRTGVGAFTHQLANWAVSPADHAHFIDPAANAENVFNRMDVTMRWPALVLRLLGMSLVVPLFEELFIRSLILRSFHRAKQTFIGFVQVLQDFPVLGEWLMNTKLGDMADAHPPMFEKQFKQNPLGALTVFGVGASTVVFMLSHVPRDYAACIMCGVSYCLLLWATRHKGLGPVCWAHGITNALLWAYTLWTSDFRFL